MGSTGATDQAGRTINVVTRLVMACSNGTNNIVRPAKPTSAFMVAGPGINLLTQWQATSWDQVLQLAKLSKQPHHQKSVPPELCLVFHLFDGLP